MNTKSRFEVVEIRRSRARRFYDISLSEEPHFFALASGVLTHNSNPMPESVKDRPTKAHEFLFLLTQQERYFYDAVAVQEPAVTQPQRRLTQPCILAGTSEAGVCPHCGAPWKRQVQRILSDRPTAYNGSSFSRGKTYATQSAAGGAKIGPRTERLETVGWGPSCACPEHSPVPAMVLDAFGGAGTVALVAHQLGRAAMYIDASEAYLHLAQDRIRAQGSETSDAVRNGPSDDPRAACIAG